MSQPGRAREAKEGPRAKRGRDDGGGRRARGGARMLATWQRVLVWAAWLGVIALIAANSDSGTLS